jgi:hypothetical protein
LKMAEPTSTTTAFGLTAVSVALLGPLAGPYALIAFAALSGAMWPLSAATTSTKIAGAWLLVRCTLTALVLTAFLSGLLEQLFGIHAVESLAPVAFCIGALGNGWRPVFDALGAAITALVGRKGGGE